MLIRSPVVAGTFYPNEPIALKKMIEDFLAKATIEKHKNQPKALIVPHAGYIYSGQTAAYAFKTLRGYSYEKIIILGPSHHFSFIGLASAPKGFWETPLGKIETIAKEDFKNLKNNSEIKESAEIHEIEHCLEVELPFLQIILNDFKIFPLLTGALNPVITAKIIREILTENSVLIISSDLSHYLPYKEAQMLDKVTLDAILANDFERFKKFGDACGKTAIEILISISQAKNWRPKLLKYSNSGETTNEKQAVVGYASIVYY